MFFMPKLLGHEPRVLPRTRPGGRSGNHTYLISPNALYFGGVALFND